MVCGTVSVTGDRSVRRVPWQGRGVSEDIRFQTAYRPNRICRRENPLPVPCSLPFLRDRREVDAGPPVTPVARHAFSALKLADVSSRLGLCGYLS
jgi:hypothetical protein